MKDINFWKEKISPKIRAINKKILVRIAIITAVVFSIFFYFYILKDLPSPKNLTNYKYIPVSTEIFDRNGKLLYKVYKDENRVPIKLNSLPKYVSQATIAIEDEGFYRHGGISIIGGVIRAFKDTVILRKSLQGGSTITQQLVKSALLTPDRTVRRKVREIILAIWTEQLYTKDQILEMYLNQVPYGGVSYGIEEASYTYFRKKAQDLTLAQAAFLAGLPRAPSAYSPYVSFSRAKKRQTEVLNRMMELKMITLQQKNKAVTEQLSIKPPVQPIKAPHFVFYVKSILEKQFGSEIVEEGGLKVTTTLDYDIQASSGRLIFLPRHQDLLM